jgi:hypothetical protein
MPKETKSAGLSRPLKLKRSPLARSQHREQQDWGQGVHLPLAATRIRNLGKERQQRARHRGNPPRWVPPIDSDKNHQGNRQFFIRHNATIDQATAALNSPGCNAHWADSHYEQGCRMPSEGEANRHWPTPRARPGKGSLPMSPRCWI